MAHNKWQQRREDFALQKVPESYRSWSWLSLTGVTLGISSAMFFLSFGGQLIHQFGTYNLILAMIISIIGISIVGVIIVKLAVHVGLNMDLISSRCGMGYKGAGFTSLIYGACFIIFFAVEGNIIADAIHTYFTTVPIWSIDLVTGLIFIPLTWYGITIINFIMWITLPIYLVLLVYWIYHVSHLNVHPQSFLHFQPKHAITATAGPIVLQLVAPALAVIVNAAVAADIGRFIPQKRQFLSIFGLTFFVNTVSFLGAALLGAWFSIQLNESNPGIYLPHYMGFWGVFMVVISQLRINILNTYSGSLAFSTFLSRLFNVKPGRQWSIIILCVLATLMLFANLLDHLTAVFSFISIFLVAWVLAVMAYILCSGALKYATRDNFKFQYGQIPNYNPVGFIPLVIAILVAAPMGLGLFGKNMEVLAPFVASIIVLCLVPILFILLKQKSFKEE